MARIAGRDARLYMNITSGGTAEPVAFLNSWSINFSTNAIDVTAFGDTNKSYVGGLPDSTGTYAGFFDTATAQTYTAATDGVARKMYLYPTTGTVGQYFYGTAIFDMSIDATVEGPVAISGDFSGATGVAKVG
jgi:hypothetical protein